MQLPTELGDVVLFDMRIRHRGRANLAHTRRPIAYLGYVRDWYRDRANFKEPQTRAFDDLPLRKLFMRLDTQEYTRALEDIVRKTNLADLEALRSRRDYHMGEMFS